MIERMVGTRFEGCDSLKDSLMSSSMGSSSHHGQSDASIEERELYKVCLAKDTIIYLTNLILKHLI